MSPKLSICIPTLNRVEFLSMLLDELIPAVSSLSVEICIYDNYSTDNTEIFLSSLASIHPTLIKVRRGSFKLSIDESMASAIKMSMGEFVFPVGDDDFIPEKSIGEIMSLLDFNYDLIVFNGYHTDSKLNPLRQHLPNSLQGLEFFDPGKAFLSIWNLMPFGSMMAKRCCFFSNKFEYWFGTSHAYVGVVWGALHEIYTRRNCKIKLTSQPLVYIRGAEKTWKRDALKIYSNEIPIWIYKVSYFPSYTRAAEQVLLSYLSGVFSLKNLIFFRLNGVLDFKSFFDCINSFGFFSILKIFFVVLLPVGLLEFLRKLKRIFAK